MQCRRALRTVRRGARSRDLMRVRCCRLLTADNQRAVHAINKNTASVPVGYEGAASNVAVLVENLILPAADARSFVHAVGDVSRSARTVARALSRARGSSAIPLDPRTR